MILIGFNAQAHGSRGVKRWNFYARDYVNNSLRSSRPHSVAILREDVQLFSFWEKMLVPQARPDMTVVAQGLAASPWYHKMMRQQNQDLILGPLREARDWQAFIQRHANRPLWVSGDANRPTGFGKPDPSGLLIYLNRAPFRLNQPLFHFYIYRGFYQKPKTPDFFAEDLVSEYASAAMRHASVFMKQKDWDMARQYTRLAQYFDPHSPSVLFHLGYIHYIQGKIERAEEDYAQASRMYEGIFQQAASYKTLPDVVAGLQKEASEVWLNRGVLAEKQNRLEEARSCYAQAVRLNPGSGQAHYNWAVTFWNRDWRQAADHLRRAVDLNPSNEKFQHYLQRAQAILNRS